MNNVKVDYISDLHLCFYLKAGENGFDKRELKQFVDEKILPKVNGEILVVAGDICEFSDSVVDFLNFCSDYYKMVYFVAGNHEYYLSRLMFRTMYEIYNADSIKKLKDIKEKISQNPKLVFLDNSNGGISEYSGFKIAGDTLWYLPSGISDWAFYYLDSNDSRLILTEDTKKEKIEKLHESSMLWYERLGNDIDLIVTHTPPLKIKGLKERNNSCYYTKLNEFKAKTWIYGHNHETADFTLNGTHFYSNPWGYKSKDFPVKTLTLKK